MTINDPQQIAIKTIDKNVAVNAGAGTGKTRTIIARALHLISTGVQPTRIKILSFTKKSAQEIAERIKIEGSEMPEVKLAQAKDAKIKISVIEIKVALF